MSQTTIRFTWNVEGVATNVTSAKLSDPTATFGVQRTDDDTTVVADNTSMVNDTTGNYSYTFTDPDPNLTYNYWIEIVYDGATYRFELQIAGGESDDGTTLDLFWVRMMRSLGRFLGWGRDHNDFTVDDLTDAGDCIAAGLNQFYFHALVPGTNVPHKWSFLKPLMTVTTNAPYDTGTITIVNGVVTLTGGTFPTWATSGELQVGGGGTYEVAVRDSSTQLTLSDTSVDADALSTYTLVCLRYDLPSDFASIRGGLTFATGSNRGRSPLREINHATIRAYRQSDVSVGVPHSYATILKTFDASVGQRYQIQLQPPADDAYTFTGNYNIQPVTMSSTSVFPYGGAQHSETIRHCILAEADMTLNDNQGNYAAKYAALLATSVLHDRHNQSTDYMGTLSEFPDGHADPNNIYDYMDRHMDHPAEYDNG